jgi:hypothetical protein
MGNVILVPIKVTIIALGENVGPTISVQVGNAQAFSFGRKYWGGNADAGCQGGKEEGSRLLTRRHAE